MKGGGVAPRFVCGCFLVSMMAVYFHENLRRPTPIPNANPPKKFKAPQKRPKLRETNGGFHNSSLKKASIFFWGVHGIGGTLR